jgi:hypothetical protein
VYKKKILNKNIIIKEKNHRDFKIFLNITVYPKDLKDCKYGMDVYIFLIPLDDTVIFFGRKKEKVCVRF